MVSREHFGPLESVVRVVWVVGVMGDEDVEAGRVGAQGEVGGLGCMVGGNSGQVHHVLTCMPPERDDDQRLVVTAGKLPVPKNWGFGVQVWVTRSELLVRARARARERVYLDFFPRLYTYSEINEMTSKYKKYQCWYSH